VGLARAADPLARKMVKGSVGLVLVLVADRKVPTEGSRKARRHISTRGKSDGAGSTATRVAVARHQLPKSAGLADVKDGGDVCALVFPRNLILRYGTTSFARASFTCVCDCEGDGGQAGTLSMNETSLARTVSSAGTWEKRIGLRERHSTAGREMEV
jgi:hypothetical protein